jgi:hypothetical protein
MTEDAELLSRYAADQSETAFAELTQRHVDLVHSAALRLMNGDLHAAQGASPVGGSIFGRGHLQRRLDDAARGARYVCGFVQK